MNDLRVMFSMEVPRGADEQPVLSQAIWEATPAPAQALIRALLAGLIELAALRDRVRELEARLGQNSRNSSRPPSSDRPQTPRRPPAAPTALKQSQGGTRRPPHVARAIWHMVWPGVRPARPCGVRRGTTSACRRRRARYLPPGRSGSALTPRPPPAPCSPWRWLVLTWCSRWRRFASWDRGPSPT